MNIIQQYAQLKADGMINKVQKTNIDTPGALTYAVYIKKFEIQGTKLVQLSDEVTAITAKELNDRLAELVAEKASIEAFIADAVNGV